MNTPSAVSESSRDLLALAARVGAEQVEEPWFVDAPVATDRRHSSAPPSPIAHVGDFLGDPLADAWLR